MANTIIIRNGTTAPTAGSFSVGEPAFDKSAGKLYVKNASGAMVEIGASAALADDSVTLQKMAASGRGVGYAATLLFG